jgi:hypothetical protein
MSRAGRQTVTGVVVNRHLNLNRTEFDRLKAVIHACGGPEDPRLADERFRAALLRKIAWAESINPARGAKLRGLLAAAWERRLAS